LAAAARGGRVASAWLAAPWLLSVVLGGGPGVHAAEAPLVSVQLEGGRLSLTAETAPLGGVLAAIAEASGIAVRVDPTAQSEVMARPVTLRLERLEVERAMAQVLGSAHYVFLYSPAGLAEVRIYASSPGGARLASGRGDAARAGNPAGRSADDEDEEDAERRAEAARWSRESTAALDPDERVQALERLSEVGDPALITRTALDVLQRDKHAEVLDAALDLLADQESLAIEPLLQFAAATPDRGLRVRALEILAERSPDDPRVPGLVRTLASRDPDPDFRETAAELLRSVQTR
jgi:hypothetical protein